MARIWEWQTGREIGHLQSDYMVIKVAFSPDGMFLAAGGEDKTVHILRTTDGQEVQRLPHDDPVHAVAFSPDGRYVVTGSGWERKTSENLYQKKGATILWEVNNGKKTVLGEHQGIVGAVAFSPDGKYVASVDEIRTVGIWTTADGQKIASMTHDERSTEYTVPEIVFSPDSNYLATAFGKTARIWEVATGKWEVATGKEVARREHRGDLHNVAFSPDGKYLATASSDTTAGLWLWRPEDLIAEACARLTRNLTHAEWRQYVGEGIPYHATCANLPVPTD